MLIFKKGTGEHEFLSTPTEQVTDSYWQKQKKNSSKATFWQMKSSVFFNMNSVSYSFNPELYDWIYGWADSQIRFNCICQTFTWLYVHNLIDLLIDHNCNDYIL